MAPKKIDDAWRQLYDLMQKYTKEWTPRVDLRVFAHATDRSVEIKVGERRIPEPQGLTKVGKWIWHGSGRRNVSTMRELAQAINDACDFVDASNPVWAEKRPGIDLSDQERDREAAYKASKNGGK